MTIQQVANATPNAKVRLYFKNDSGTGVLETIASHAVNPNRSQRFFPPLDSNPRDMGWPVPYWYAEECYGFVLL